MTQLRGLVTVAYYVGKMEGEFSSDTNKKLRQMQTWFPIKLPAIHICFDNPRLRAWVPLGKMLMGKHLRQRLRIHDGTYGDSSHAT